MNMPRLRHRFTNIRGTIAVKGTGSGGPYLSSLERDAFIWWHFQNAVSCIRLQPAAVRVQGERREVDYEGDLAIRFSDASRRRPALVQIKYRSFLERHPEIHTHYERVARSLNNQNSDFIVQTETDIRTPAFPWMRFVFGYVGNQPSQYDSRIQEMVATCGTVRLGDICSGISDIKVRQLETVGAVWRLVAIRTLSVDFGRPLNLDALLSVNASGPLPTS